MIKNPPDLLSRRPQLSPARESLRRAVDDPGRPDAGTAQAPNSDRMEKVPRSFLHVPHHAPPPAGTATALATTETPLPAARLHRSHGVGLVSYGADPRALDETARCIAAVTQDPDVARAMQREKVTVVVIPADRRLTDLPEFAELRGQRTFDGRDWGEVRGVGGLRLDDGRLVVGVPEENLLRSPGNSYQGDYDVTLHELAHVVQDYCLPDRLQRRIDRLFDARTDDGLPFSDSYAAANSREYFAQATNVYFGRNEGQGVDDPTWLERHDPELQRLLAELYPDRTWPATPELVEVPPSTPPPAGSLISLLRGNRTPEDS
jgi:hypothetical protein